jgi:hypothetical protein
MTTTVTLDAGHPPTIIAAQAITGVLRQLDVNLPFVLCGELADGIYRGLGEAPLVRSTPVVHQDAQLVSSNLMS